MKTAIKRLAVVFVLMLPFVNSLRCYTCTYTMDSTDKSCIDNPNAVIGSKITNCAKKYCTIIRQELKSPKGVVKTFSRGCEDKPTQLNGMTEDADHKFYYSSCMSDLCNSGNGKSTGSILDPDPGAGENQKIKGKNIAGRLTSNTVYAYVLVITCTTLIKMVFLRV